MKKNQHITFLFLFFASIFCNQAMSQDDHFVYAITSLQKSGTDWVCLRKLNTETNQFTTIMMNDADNDKAAIYDAHSMKKIISFLNDTFAKSNPQMAFGSGVAAIAFDKQTNRLFYAPVLINELRYVDLNTMKTFSVTDQSFSKAGKFDFYPAAISRMVIAPDGYGYTITNDGNHLLRFNTSGNIEIADLGELSDMATNNETIHNFCGNAGGDMVADDNGSLYLISASNRIFKVDIGSRNTQFLGTITGLPPTFTTNGTAVDENGNIIVSSSVYSDSYFSVNPKTWDASVYKPMNEMFTTADLANSNVLQTRPPSFLKTVTSNSNKIKAYPNPIFNDGFKIQFSDFTTGLYTIQLTDEFGSMVSQRKIKISQSLQTENFDISGGIAQGFYFLRILDENGSSIYKQIMIVER